MSVSLRLTSFFSYSWSFPKILLPISVSVASGLDKVVMYGGKLNSSDITGQVGEYLLDYSGKCYMTINITMSIIRRSDFQSQLMLATYYTSGKN